MEQFTVDYPSDDISPENTETIYVYFSPLTSGIHSAELTLITNANDDPQPVILLTGIGVAPDITVSADTLDFGDLVLPDTTTISSIV